MRILLTVMVLSALGVRSARGEEAAAPLPGGWADLLARLAQADERAALRLFRAEGPTRETEHAVQAAVAAAVWTRCATPQARAELVRSIESRSLAGAVATLRAALGEADESAVVAALAALANLNLRDEGARVVALASRPEAAVRARAAWALGALGGDAAPDTLLALLADPEPRVRARAAASLGRVGGPAHVAPLALLLRDPAPEPRGEAAVALGRLGDSSRAPAVAALLASSDSEERWRAARALGEMGATAQATSLARLLTHDDPWARGLSAWSLGLLDARAHTQEIARLLSDPNAWVRVHAVQALGRLEARGHAPEIARRLTDMANCACLRYEDPERVAFAPAVVGQTAMQVLERWGWDLTAQAARIAATLDASEAKARCSSIEALVMLGARQHTPAIHACLADPTWAVRRDALWALAVLGAAQHVADVARALQDPEPTIRAQALWALGILNGRAHREALESFVDDETLACCVAGSTSPLPTECVGRQSTLSDFAREALERLGPE